ncbi:hypothetical protein SAMN05661091_3220 [Paenibacillus uliginis N3/975]|uniref:Uncharacterized protein n=1 Tax=Paenibacillus uliginis N3/975 TaxID=1313296 RepID=A0A1X7HGX3_9BACL|nr:hypothetical protein [Paenibacillus uliginis]SMF85942.1 hypothetical protein SAMN05661091_3220 [Paenibacillus uliginis N3/975]
MRYEINGVMVDSAEVLEYLQKNYLLHVCKYVQEKTGCTLAEARQLYEKMIQDEGIEEKPSTLEIRAYLMAGEFLYYLLLLHKTRILYICLLNPGKTPK